MRLLLATMIKTVLSVVLFIASCLYFYSYFTHGEYILKERFTLWNKCIKSHINGLDQTQLWQQIGTASNSCQPLLELTTPRLQGFENNDEIKWHLLPIDSQLDSIIISLGIGCDTVAEEKLKPRLSENSLFIGTDPDLRNFELYRKVGRFLPMTVGDREGNQSVDHIIDTYYVKRDTFMLTLPTLLTEYLPPRTKIIDNIWIDIEFSEFDIFHYFFNPSEIFKKGYGICQFNVEIHKTENDDQLKKFFEFVTKIMEDDRFAFVNTITYKDNWRMFFLNYSNKECVRRYLLEE